MLESYEAVYENGQLKWLNEQPGVDSVRVIVTVLKDADDSAANLKRRRVPPDSIAGKGKTLGDIISPLVPEADWECLK